jgi:hypothetical protein
MKKLLIVCIVSAFLFSCQQGKQPVVDTKDYFAQQDSGMQSGNVKFVEVESFGKKFKVDGPSRNEGEAGISIT